jgi:peptide/nickel transport system permease protein
MGSGMDRTAAGATAGLATIAGLTAEVTTPRNRRLTNLKKIRKNRLSVLSLVILVVVFAFSFVGPFFSPYREDKVDVKSMYQPPSKAHILGTDNMGRDVLTRLMLAGRISLAVGIFSMLLSVILGGTIGAASAFYGGVADTVVMRFSDALMSIPEMPMLLMMGALLSVYKVGGDKRIFIVMLMISLIGWPKLARLVRSQVLSLKEQPFMQATEILGLNDFHKIFFHLLPNTMPLLIVEATLDIARAIVDESVLSFLGIGVVPPAPSWGNMISAANNMIDFQMRPWLWLSPGVVIFITVISINIFGDGLRETFDPKMRSKKI